MKIKFPLIFSSSLAFGQWVPADPFPDPVPTPYPGPSALQVEINELRDQHNLYQLAETVELDCAAYKHAKDLYASGKCSHMGSDGSTFQVRARGCNTDAYAEIIACGFRLPRPVIERWIADRTSKSILISPDLVALGSAHVGNVWVVLFQ